MTRVPQIANPLDIAAPPLGGHARRSRLPIWLRVVLEFISDGFSAIF